MRFDKKDECKNDTCRYLSVLQQQQEHEEHEHQQDHIDISQVQFAEYLGTNDRQDDKKQTITILLSMKRSAL